jgi:hypothetical protein
MYFFEERVLLETQNTGPDSILLRMLDPDPHEMNASPRTLVSSSNATAKCKKCMDVLVCVDSGYENGME